MLNQIHSAIKCLETYQTIPFDYQSTLSSFEMKKRESLLKNCLNQLKEFLTKPTTYRLNEIIDELQEVLQINFQEQTFLEPKFSQMLLKISDLLNDYRHKRFLMERTRESIHNYFADFPQSIKCLTNDVQQIINSIEKELNVINHENCEKYPTEEEQGIVGSSSNCWKNLNDIYQNSSNLKNSETDIFNSAFAFEKDLAVNCSKRNSDKNPVVMISKVFLNLAINLRYYYKQLLQYQHIQSVQLIKTNIRHVSRLCSHVENTLCKVLKAKNRLRKKVSSLFKQNKFSDNILVRVHSFIDVIFDRFKYILKEMQTFKQCTFLTFAYVLDESVLRLRRKNVLSRLDLLLAGKDFDPLEDERLFRAYECQLAKAALSIRHDTHKVSV